MIISVILLIFSFLLEGFLSNYMAFSLGATSAFSTVFTLITFVVLYPYFQNEKKYYLLLIIFGLLFDMVYTNTFIFNAILFLLVGIILQILSNIFPNNIIGLIITSLLSIFAYNILSFIFLSLVNYYDFSLMLLLKILLNSVAMTIIYTLVIYYVSNYLFKRFKIQQIK
jgi:rod shape-determining protein MreD